MSIRPEAGFEAQLPPASTTPGIARRMLAAELVGQGLDLEAFGPTTAMLVLSELVTNAVAHARPPIAVSVHLNDKDWIRIDVADGADGVPNRCDSLQPDQIGGWGIELVAQYSTAWGVSSRADQPTGKVVWAEIDLRSPRPSRT